MSSSHHSKKKYKFSEKPSKQSGAIDMSHRNTKIDYLSPALSSYVDHQIEKTDRLLTKIESDDFDTSDLLLDRPPIPPGSLMSDDHFRRGGVASTSSSSSSPSLPPPAPPAAAAAAPYHHPMVNLPRYNKYSYSTKSTKDSSTNDIKQGETDSIDSQYSTEIGTETGINDGQSKSATMIGKQQHNHGGMSVISSKRDANWINTKDKLDEIESRSQQRLGVRLKEWREACDQSEQFKYQVDSLDRVTMAVDVSVDGNGRQSDLNSEGQLLENTHEMIENLSGYLQELATEMGPIVFNEQSFLHLTAKELSEDEQTSQAIAKQCENEYQKSKHHSEQLEKQLQSLQIKLREARQSEAIKKERLERAKSKEDNTTQLLNLTEKLKSMIDSELQSMGDIEKRLRISEQDLKESYLRFWQEFQDNWQQWRVPEIQLWLSHLPLSQKFECEMFLKRSGVSGGMDLKDNRVAHRLLEFGVKQSSDRDVLRKELTKLTLPKNMPDHFKCALTKRLMKDPVVAADGFTYERQAIQQWFDSKRGAHSDSALLSPVTGEPLTSTLLFSNLFLAEQIHAFSESQS